MIEIGLTGGIACGKSFIRSCFEDLGVSTIDADQVARHVMLPKMPAYNKVIEVFGGRILSPDGTIDRSGLGQIIFSNDQARAQLNAIVHPYILEEETQRLAALQSSGSTMAVVDAALMIETGSYRRYEILIVAYCTPRIQLERLMKRDAIPRIEAEKKIRSQMPALDKVKYADYLIETSGSRVDTQEQVLQVYREIQARFATPG